MSGAESKNTLAVSVVGWLGLLFAAAYAVAAGVLLFIEVAIMTEAAPPAKPTGWEGLAVIIAVVAGVLGVLFAIQGCLGTAAGVGVLLRRRWGQILTFVTAPLTIVWGVAFILVSTMDSWSLLLGAAQIAYGLVAVIILASSGAEFREPGRRARRPARADEVLG